MNRLERTAWPEDVRASEEKLRDRLATFGKGFWGAFIAEHLVGMVSSQIVCHEEGGHPPSWDALTADGWISKTHREDGNCLHFVSVCVHPEFRHRGIATLLNRARLALAESLGLRWALTDTRMPGFSEYLKRSPEATPEGYIEAVLSGRVAEPVIAMYLNLGFRVLGLIPNCMRSDVESSDYGLAMIKEIKG
jgi:GNAT superfamily N-acetyltransferase